MSTEMSPEEKIARGIERLRDLRDEDDARRGEMIRRRRRLIRALVRQGASLGQIAASLGVTTQTVSRWAGQWSRPESRR